MNEENDSHEMLDLPELNGQLLACSVLIGKLLDVLLANGLITQEQAQTMLSHSDLRVGAVCHDLKKSIPAAVVKRMESQADLFFGTLSRDITPRRPK
jgi:hypothetical protein